MVAMDRFKMMVPRLKTYGKVLLLVLFVIACVNGYSQYQRQRNTEAEVSYRIGMDHLLAHHHDLAATHISEAAEKGYDIAQNRLGLLYSFGVGVKQDYSKALHWYLKAAEQGNTAAQHNIGWAYEYGEGVEKDNQKAAEWFRKAAEHGNKHSQYALERLIKEDQLK